MSEAKLRLTTSQTMMATSLPQNTRTQGQGFRENLKTLSPSLCPPSRPISVIWAQPLVLRTALRVSCPDLALHLGSAQGCWVARLGKG